MTDDPASRLAQKTLASEITRTVHGDVALKSVLDDVPGLGPTRRKRLVKELGGVNAVKHATLEELDDLKWLPEKVAHALYLKLHGLPVP